MNPAPDETNELRSEIDTTRRRMDDTIGALGERLQGRHLVDEVLGFFRQNSDQSREIGQKITQTASTAMHSVTDTIKANPVPALLIGAGVGWMIYQNSRASHSHGYDARFDDEGYPLPDDPDADGLYDRPLEYTSGGATPAGAGSFGSDYNAGGSIRGTGPGGETSSKIGQAVHQVAEKASQATQQVKQRLTDASASLRDRSHTVGEQAREIGTRVQERARQTYRRSRERVVSTATEHPLELGLACLALGVIAGLAVRTPARLDRAIGPSVDRLKDRTRQAGGELLQKGQRVAQAAAEAAKEEARSQGLAGEQSGNASSRDADRSEGNPPPKATSSGHSQPSADPLVTRPGM